MLPHLSSSLHLARLTRQHAGAASVVLLVGAGAVWYSITRKKIDLNELERTRRTLLAADGRIIDGSIIGIDGITEDTSPDGSLDLAASGPKAPRVLLYRYRLAGVIYECAQDVSALQEQVKHLRIDLPVQVRYDPHNPGDSIVVAESWNGLQQDTVPGPDDLILPPV